MSQSENETEQQRREGASASVVAERFHLHPETIRRWARAGRVPAYRAGKSWRFDLTEVEAALRAKGASK